MFKTRFQKGTVVIQLHGGQAFGSALAFLVIYLLPYLVDGTK